MKAAIANRVRKLEAVHYRADERCWACAPLQEGKLAPLEDAVIIPQPDHPNRCDCHCKWCGRGFGVELSEQDGVLMAREVGPAHREI